jgi:uncharacterized protein
MAGITTLRYFKLVEEGLGPAPLRGTPVLTSETAEAEPMQFENSFSVVAPIDKVWAYLLDVQAVAPCLPGAELTETVSDTEYKGSVKIKLGAMQVNYKGSVVLKEVDEGSRRVVMTATGSETRGTGGASGTVTSTLTADGPEKTTIHLLSEVNITGRVAQFGRNIIQDVSNKLIRDFAQCLEANLTAGQAAHSDQGASAVGPSAAASAERPSGGETHAPTEGSTTDQPGSTDLPPPAPIGVESGEPAPTAGASAATHEAPPATREEEPSASASIADPNRAESTVPAGPLPRAGGPERPASTPPIGMPAYGGAELKLAPLLLDITRSRLASGLRALAHLVDPDK